jgi:hypothetical protein
LSPRSRCRPRSTPRWQRYRDQCQT